MIKEAGLCSFEPDPVAGGPGPSQLWTGETPSGTKWALRLQRPGYQSKNSLASEIAWLLALRNDGVAATPVPVAGLNGEWIQVVGQRNLVLFEWENGRQPEIEMDLRQCFNTLGAVTAQLHAHSRTWQRPGSFERFTWDFEAAGFDQAKEYFAAKTLPSRTILCANDRTAFGVMAAEEDLEHIAVRGQTVGPEIVAHQLARGVQLFIDKGEGYF